ncbi:MAG: hypothetical protein ABI679_04185 [Gemmatimonadota bacterium]
MNHARYAACLSMGRQPSHGVDVLKGIFGSNSLTHLIRGGLEETSASHRVIASRVAGALNSSSSVDFADTLNQKTAASKQQVEADLQRDMTELADTTIRYEADSKLLQQAYARLRTAISDHA